MTLEAAPTIVLFDMDGTTVRHVNPQLLTVLETLDDIAHKVAKFFSKLLNRKIQSPPLVEKRDGKRRKLLVHRAIHKIRRKDVDQIVEPCPGIYDILDFLQGRGVMMGIISNGLGKGYGRDILQTFDLNKYFSTEIFREDIQRTKPYPDGILQALAAMPRQPDADDIIWFIGDRQKDVMAAVAAASHLPCPVEPIAYNLHAAVAILKHNYGTDHIYMAWPDLLLKLENIFRKSKK
jgi:phosphoglycolate phosphatase